MGKSHIGLVYSQQINEVLDQLANLVSISGLFLGLPSTALASLPGLGLVASCGGFPLAISRLAYVQSPQF